MSVSKLILIFLTVVNHVSSTCIQIPNDEMIEYVCENSNPYDIYSIPERTEKIRITNANLSRVTSDTFSRFGDNLWVLACSHCQISEITSDAFKALTNLQQLRLDNNHLSTVKASWFEGLKYLTYLDLNYNEIETVEDGVFNNLPDLVDLRIAGNKLQCLNVDEMSRLHDLKRIFLNRNPDFKCPNAIFELLREKSIDYERDPEWEKITEDLIKPVTSPTHYEWRTQTSSSTPMYRERLIVSYPIDSTTSVYTSSSNYPSSGLVNYPTSASYPSNEIFIQAPHEWLTHESYPTRPAISETYYPINYGPVVSETRPNEYVSSSPAHQEFDNEYYYPPQSFDPYRQDTQSVVLPTTTAKIFWSESDEVFNETDYLPIETMPPTHRESSVDEESPNEPPYREGIEKYQTLKPPIQQEYSRPYPLENYQKVDELSPVTVFIATVTTTDKPLPECNSSTPTGISIAIIFFTIFHYILIIL